jgi:hypothetical protein
MNFTRGCTATRPTQTLARDSPQSCLTLRSGQTCLLQPAPGACVPGQSLWDRICVHWHSPVAAHIWKCKTRLCATAMSDECVSLCCYKEHALACAPMRAEHAFQIDFNQCAPAMHGALARYAYMTMKHGDGFCMYDSVTQPYWNAVAVGAKRDLFGDFATAIKVCMPACVVFYLFFLSLTVACDVTSMIATPKVAVACEMIFCLNNFDSHAAACYSSTSLGGPALFGLAR